mmetsp:Transcript_144088/g.461257  ORF Transcript_144088/g.461257 Transcript_144088/m.461257 type:complete len:233 (+) Transcript_144088:713-1411(+)
MLRPRRHEPRWRDADPRWGDHRAGAASGWGGEAAGRRELPRHTQRHGPPTVCATGAGAQEAHDSRNHVLPASHCHSRSRCCRHHLRRSTPNHALRHGPCDGRSRPHGRDPEAIRRNWSRQPARHEPWPNRERWPRRPTDRQCHGGSRVQAGHAAVWRWRPLDKGMCRQRRRRGRGAWEGGPKRRVPRHRQRRRAHGDGGEGGGGEGGRSDDLHLFGRARAIDVLGPGPDDPP